MSFVRNDPFLRCTSSTDRCFCTACIAPNGQEFKVGDKIDVEGFGIHSCDKKSETEVSMKSGNGCEEKGNLVKINEFVTEGTMKKVCVYRSNNYTMEAYCKI